MQAFVRCKHFKQRQGQLNIQGSTSDAKSVRCAKPCPVWNHAPLLYTKALSVTFGESLLKLLQICWLYIEYGFLVYWVWGKFRQLLPLLTNHQVPLLTRGKCPQHVWGVWCYMQQSFGPWRRIHWTASGVMTMPWSCQGKGRSKVRLPSQKAWHPGLRCGAPHQ